MTVLWFLLVTMATALAVRLPDDVILQDRVERLESLMTQQGLQIEQERAERQAVDRKLREEFEREKLQWAFEKEQWAKERQALKDAIKHLQYTTDHTAEGKGEVSDLPSIHEAMVSDDNKDPLRSVATDRQQSMTQKLALKAAIKQLHDKPNQEIQSTAENTNPSNPAQSMVRREDDRDPLESVVSETVQKLNVLDADVQALKNSVKEASSSIFVRWGRSVCPHSSETVYSGVIGGSFYTQNNANYLCLSMSPVFSQHRISNSQDVAHLYGAEYQTHDSHYDHDPVCVVCRSPRPTVVMVPGTNVCFPGWTLEYSGFLMADTHVRTSGASEFICVDSQLESRPGTSANLNGRVLFYTETVCGSLPCGPYANNKVVTCAVCSK